MEVKMKRSITAVVSSLALAAIALAICLQVTPAYGQSAHQPGHDNNGQALANATVSFGGWMTDPPLDRFPNENPIAPNHHRLTPTVATIRRGGTVNFIIGGFHHVLVYDNGTRPEDVDATITIAPTNGGPPLIADPEDRIYRGLDPSLQPQDRVEVVHFNRPGLYLVICGVLPHFQDGMYGYVRVIGGRNDTASD
jgi:hypothetical protein